MSRSKACSTPYEARSRKVRAATLSAVLAGVFLSAALAWAAQPVSLKTVPVPEPVNLHRFVKDKAAAVRLGKALFWDMQVGSDGVTACASCHFHAGADNRVRNQVNPAVLAGDTTFQAGARPRPDAELTTNDFPFLLRQDFEDRFSTVLRDVNDAVSSQGVVMRAFEAVKPGRAEDSGRLVRDGVYCRNGRNTRQVEPRNSPSVINAVFHFTQFWDGRANHFFNGVNPFGIMDVNAHVWINQNGLLLLNLTENPAVNGWLLNNASLASQAVGPTLSDLEMSWRGRTFPEVGRKMLSLWPLARQEVHSQDGVLAGLRHASGRGLDTSYTAMIQAAFLDEFWNGA